MALYGSLTNRLLERQQNPRPQVGLCVTEYLYTDRHAYEIVAVKDDRHISVRRLDAKLISVGGIFGTQKYEYSSNTAAPLINLFQKKDGRWVERVGKHGEGVNTFVLGIADEYYDPSF